MGEKILVKQPENQCAKRCQKTSEKAVVYTNVVFGFSSCLTIKESGILENKALNRPHKKIDPEKLRTYAEEHPDAYQREMANEFGCSVTAVPKALQRLGITRKKRQLNYKKQIKGIPLENIAYIDETGIDTYLFREHGYAPKG